MTSGQQAHLAQLCRIFEIPLSATEPNPELAYNVLLRMYLVPTIASKSERNRALNEIRGNLAGHFDLSSVFVGRTATIAATMQELPHWWADLNRPTSELVEIYLSLGKTIQALKLVGIGAGASAVGSGTAEAIKSGSIRQGARKTVERAIGMGGVLDETVKKLGRVGRVGKSATPVGLAVAVGGTVLYASAVDRQQEIRLILVDRYQNGKMSDDDYRKVFGNDFDAVRIRKYWE